MILPNTRQFLTYPLNAIAALHESRAAPSATPHAAICAVLDDGQAIITTWTWTTGST